MSSINSSTHRCSLFFFLRCFAKQSVLPFSSSEFCEMMLCLQLTAWIILMSCIGSPTDPQLISSKVWHLPIFHRFCSVELSSLVWPANVPDFHHHPHTFTDNWQRRPLNTQRVRHHTLVCFTKYTKSALVGQHPLVCFINHTKSRPASLGWVSHRADRAIELVNRSYCTTPLCLSSGQSFFYRLLLLPLHHPLKSVVHVSSQLTESMSHAKFPANDAAAVAAAVVNNFA